VSSEAEGDCDCPAPTKEASEPLPREVWVLIAANVVVALGYGVVAPVLPQYARHFGVSISAATFVITAFALMRLVAAPPRTARAAVGGAAGLHQRTVDRGVVHWGVCVCANVLATAALPFARRARIGDVHGIVAGPDDPDLATGCARAVSRACSRRASLSARSAARCWAA
jgi:MFS family permease